MKISLICFKSLALASLCLIPLASARAQLANNSTRVTIGTNDAISIEAFVIQGSQPKKIIVRGIGPSLAMSGIPNALQDPVLSIYDSSGVLLIRNDNWRDTQESEIEATGIAPSDDRESAIVATLPPGAYAVALVGKNHTTGIGINEMYDLESQNSQITGIGVRGNALPSPEVVISGFILQGNQSQTLLLRALGPSLEEAGIGGVLLDPLLELHSANGQQIASNDNWQDTQAAEIQATGLAPTDYRESAILVTLTPGIYTLVETRSSGITFVDEYVLPQHEGKPLNPVPHLTTSALAVSRKIHGATPYDVLLPLTGIPGIECRGGGTSNAYRVVLTFFNRVTFSGAEVTSGAGSVASATGSGTKIVKLDLTGVLSGQTIQITLAGIDDGTSISDLVIPMSVLIGDTNGSGTVNATDISNIKAQAGHSITLSNFREDLNANGSINGSDVAFAKSKSGTALSGGGINGAVHSLVDHPGRKRGTSH
jgi:Dockerin type I domain